jgi:hypothetical protein
MEAKLKDFVEYVDVILASENKDVNAIKNAAQMFLEFQKKSEVINSDFISLAQAILDEIQEDNLASFCTGLHLGIILGKYSKKIAIENVSL